MRSTSLNKKERITDAMMIFLSEDLVPDPQGMEDATDLCRWLFCKVWVDDVEDGLKPGRRTSRDEEGEDEVAKGCFVPHDERDEQGRREDDRRDVDSCWCVVELVIPSHGRSKIQGAGSNVISEANVGKLRAYRTSVRWQLGGGFGFRR